MPNLTTVGLTGGLGTSGTGTISTLDNLLGTAGTANTNVLSVQGIASGTAQPVSGTVTANAGTNLNTSALALETGGNLATVAGAVSSSKMNVNISSGAIPAGTNVIGSVKATDGTNTAAVKAANTAPLATDPALVVTLSPNGATLASAVQITDGTHNAAVKAASTPAGATDPALVVALSPNNVDVGSGTGGSHTIRTIIDSSQLAAANTTAQAMSAAYQLVALPTDQVVPNKLQSQTNGATSSRVVAAASTNATNLKASAGAITEIDVFNVAAYSVFLKIYNKASSPTVGTDTPVWTIPIAAGTGYSKSFRYGKWLGTGVSYAITKLQADSDTTVLVAGDVTGSIDWI